MVTTYTTVVVIKTLNTLVFRVFSFLASRYTIGYIRTYYVNCPTYYPTKKRMNEISYKQKVNKLDKQGKAPIFLEFNHDGSTLVYATGEKCAVDEWNADTQKFRRSMPGYQQANESLQLLRERLTVSYRQLRDTGQLVTSNQLRASLRPNQKQSIVTDLPTLYGDYLIHCKSINYKSTTLKSMAVSGGRIGGFASAVSKLAVGGYTADNHARFLRYLTDDLQLHPNSVANIHSERTLGNRCNQRGRFSPTSTPTTR